MRSLYLLSFLHIFSVVLTVQAEENDNVTKKEHLQMLGALKGQADLSLSLLKYCAQARGWTKKAVTYSKRHKSLVNKICEKQFGKIDEENDELKGDIKRIEISKSLPGKKTSVVSYYKKFSPI